MPKTPSHRRIYIDAYATLRFCGESINPIAITRMLLLPPDSTYHPGEPRVSRRRNGDISVLPPREIGHWSMSSKHRVDSPKLAVHVEWILEQIEPKKEEICSLLDEGLYADIFCFSYGHAKKAPSLSTALRKRASHIGLAIEIDHYEGQAE